MPASGSGSAEHLGEVSGVAEKKIQPKAAGEKKDEKDERAATRVTKKRSLRRRAHKKL